MRDANIIGGTSRWQLDRRAPVSYKCHMSVLAIRISDKEKALLAKRVMEAGVSTGVLVRDLIKAEPIVTSADLLKEMNSLLGVQNLRIKVRR